MGIDETIERIALNASSAVIEEFLSELPADALARLLQQAIQEIELGVRAQIQSSVRSHLQWSVQSLRLEAKKIELPILLDVDHQRLQSQ